MRDANDHTDADSVNSLSNILVKLMTISPITYLKLITPTFFVLGVLWWLRPEYHMVWEVLIVKNSNMIQWVVIAAIFYILNRATRRYTNRQVILRAVFIGLFALSLITAFIISPILGAGQVNQQMYQQNIKQSASVSTLPNTNLHNPRLNTMSVMRTQTRNSLQTTTHKLGPQSIVWQNGSYRVAYPLVPDGILNGMTKHQNGTAYADWSTLGKSTTVNYSQTGMCGPSESLSGNYKWHLDKKQYSATYGTPKPIQYHGESVLMVPMTATKQTFVASPLPQFVPVQKPAGVMLVHHNCSVTHLSQHQAATDSGLKNQVTVSLSMIKTAVASQAYKHGLISKLTGNRNDLSKLATVPAQNNHQPFVVPTVNGARVLTMMEPMGNTNGLRSVWISNGHSLNMTHMTFKTPVDGPGQAAKSIRGTYPNIQWQSMSKGGSAQVSEIRPLIRNGSLWWVGDVVTSESGGVSFLAFENARTGQVVRVRSDAKAYAFLRQGQASSLPSQNQSVKNGSEKSPSMVVLVTNQQGTVVRKVPVYGNESVKIKQVVNRSVASTPS